jgi:abortive infection bacteriophage resistance protein
VYELPILKKIDFYNCKQIQGSFRFSSKSLDIFKKNSLFLKLKQMHPKSYLIAKKLIDS